jgi:hypothetical protein
MGYVLYKNDVRLKRKEKNPNVRISTGLICPYVPNTTSILTIFLPETNLPTAMNSPSGDFILILESVFRVSES